MDGLGYDRSTEGMRAVLQSLMGCASSGLYSKYCTAGAVGGGLASIINSLLAAREDCTPEQVEARRNLVASLVMGVAKLTKQQVETATSIAMQETMLNWASEDTQRVLEIGVDAVVGAAVLGATVSTGGAAALPAAAGGVVARATLREGLRILIKEGPRLALLMKAAVVTLGDKIEKADLHVYDGKVHLCTTLKGQGTYHCQEDLKNIGKLSHIEDWAMGIMGELYQNSGRLPGKPGEVIRLSLNPRPWFSAEEKARMRTPGYSAAPVGSIAVPGQENKGPIEGLTTISPMSELKGPDLIFDATENRVKGRTFENAVLDYLSQAKNTRSFTAQVGDKLVTVIPDGVTDDNKILEIKDVLRLSNSDQFRAYVQLVNEGGTLKRGGGLLNGASTQFKGIDLIVAPGTRISKNLEDFIYGNNGSVRKFDVEAKTIKPWK
jgi:filamentous hemagglutinin